MNVIIFRLAVSLKGRHCEPVIVAFQKVHGLLWNLVQTFMVPRGWSLLISVIPWLPFNASRRSIFKVIQWNMSTSSGLAWWLFCADSHGHQKHWSMKLQFVVFRVKVYNNYWIWRTHSWIKPTLVIPWVFISWHHQVKYLLCLIQWFIS